MNIDTLMKADGFINMSGKQCVSQDKEYIYKMLHKEDPIKKLKEFGIFSDKTYDTKNYISYTGKYMIDDLQRANYLISRKFVIEKKIQNNKVRIDYGDFDTKCPLYKLTIKRTDGTIINDNTYKVLIACFYNKMRFEMCDDNKKIYEILGKNMHHKFGKIITDTTLIYNDYIDYYQIHFNENDQDIIIEFEIYDIYLYKSFFECGWLFT